MLVLKLLCSCFFLLSAICNVSKCLEYPEMNEQETLELETKMTLHFREIDEVLEPYELVGFGENDFSLSSSLKNDGKAAIAEFIKYVANQTNHYFEKLAVYYASEDVLTKEIIHELSETFGDTNLTEAELNVMQFKEKYDANTLSSDVRQLFSLFKNLTNPEHNYYKILKSNETYTVTESQEALMDILRLMDEKMMIAFESRTDPRTEKPYCYEDFSDLNNEEFWGNFTRVKIMARLFMKFANPHENLATEAEHYIHVLNSDHGPAAKTIMFVFVTLLVGGLLKFALKVITEQWTISFPYTVIVMLLGLIFGVFVALDRFYWKTDQLSGYVELPEADPHVLLLIFLPVLIFESSYAIEPHLFLKLVTQIMFLASFGVLLATCLTAIVAYAIFKEELGVKENGEYRIDPLFTLTIGIISSATDPVAVVSLLKEVGASKMLGMFIEGESLFNDGTAIVIYNVFLRIINTPESETLVVDTLVSLVLVVIGSPIFGFLGGVLMAFSLNQIYNLWEAELMIMVCSPFLVFYCAEALFGMSGVIAVTVTGIVMSNYKTAITSELVELVHKTWEILAYCGNTLLFAIVGILLAETVVPNPEADVFMSSGTIFNIIAFYLMCMIIRPFMMFLASPFIARFGYGPRIVTPRNLAVSSWGGLRGGVSMALALSAREDPGILREYGEAGAQTILICVGTVVFLTLLINATTMPMLLGVLGMSKLSEEKKASYRAAMRDLINAKKRIIDTIKRDKMLSDTSWETVLRDTYIPSPIPEKDEEPENWTFRAIPNPPGVPTTPLLYSEVLTKEKDEDEEKDIARHRVLQALRESFCRQYEDGILTASGLKTLENHVDNVKDVPNGMLVPELALETLQPTKWDKFKGVLQKEKSNMGKSHTHHIPEPEGKFRRRCYYIAYSSWFLAFIYTIIVIDISIIIIDLALNFGSESITITAFDWFIFGISVFFLTVYTVEFVIKFIAWHWSGYWGQTCWNFNRFDFALLIYTWLEMGTTIFDYTTRLIEFDEDETSALKDIARTMQTVKVVRILRLIRMVRFFKPLVPLLLKFVEVQISKQLNAGYDIAKAYVVGQDEVSKIIHTIVVFPPFQHYFKDICDQHRVQVTKALGLLSENRPDISTAIKTRQSIRQVLNQVKHRLAALREEGVIDEDEQLRFENIFDKKFKNLVNFPNSIPAPGRRELLKNLIWLHNQPADVLNAIGMAIQEKNYIRGDVICSKDKSTDAIILVVNGLVKILAAREDLVEVEDEEQFVLFADSMFFDWEEGTTAEYVPRGNVINDVSCIFQINRVNDVLASSEEVKTYQMNLETLQQFTSVHPQLEYDLMKHVSSSVSMLILNSLPSFTMLSFEHLRNTIQYGFVQLVQPLVEITGLERFQYVFLVHGLVEDAEHPDHQPFEGPVLLPNNILKVITLPKNQDQFTKSDDSRFLKGERLEWKKYALFYFVGGEENDFPAGLYDDETQIAMDQTYAQVGYDASMMGQLATGMKYKQETRFGTGKAGARKIRKYLTIDYTVLGGDDRKFVLQGRNTTMQPGSLTLLNMRTSLTRNKRL